MYLKTNAGDIRRKQSHFIDEIATFIVGGNLYRKILKADFLKIILHNYTAISISKTD